MSRKKHGSLIVDAPLALWILFVLITIPMIDLAAVMIRYTFLVAASRDAASAASKAKSFLADISSTEKSAVNLAVTTANRTASSFAEVTINQVNTRIVITDLASLAVSRRNAPLASPADTDLNLYEIETLVDGQVNPLIPFTSGLLPGVPGLSAPIRVSVVSRQFVENPQGLNQ